MFWEWMAIFFFFFLELNFKVGSSSHNVTQKLMENVFITLCYFFFFSFFYLLKNFSLLWMG